MLKKCLSLILFFVLVAVVFVGCDSKDTKSLPSNNSLQTSVTEKTDTINATLNAEKEKYSEDVDTITLTIQNNEDNEIYYSPNFSLEVKENGKWTKVEKSKTITEDFIGVVKKGESKEVRFDIESQYDELKSGEYKTVVKLSSGEKNVDNGEEFSDEFIIK